MNDLVQQIDKKLNELLPPESIQPTRLHAAMRYSVFSGGKRARPTLCILACEALGGSFDDAVVPACAIEVLHAYTLIHDDLPGMDNDDMRRGKPTCHKQFDEATAILAGDALLTLAFELLGTTGNATLVHELAHATGSVGTIGGQQDDMDYKSTLPTKEQLLEMHRKKTANLLATSCVMGALCAKASQADIDQMRVFGNALGAAFQLLDDVCDNDPVTMKVIGREETMKLIEGYKQASYEALDALSCDTTNLKALSDRIYQSFAV